MLTVSSAATVRFGGCWNSSMGSPAPGRFSTCRMGMSQSARTSASATDSSKPSEVTTAADREWARMWPASSARYCWFTGTIAAPSRASASQVRGNSARLVNMTATRSPAVIPRSASAAARPPERRATCAKVRDSPGSNVQATRSGHRRAARSTAATRSSTPASPTGSFPESLRARLRLPGRHCLDRGVHLALERVRLRRVDPVVEQ